MVSFNCAYCSWEEQMQNIWKTGCGSILKSVNVTARRSDAQNPFYQSNCLQDVHQAWTIQPLLALNQCWLLFYDVLWMIEAHIFHKYSGVYSRFFFKFDWSMFPWQFGTAFTQHVLSTLLLFLYTFNSPGGVQDWSSGPIIDAFGFICSLFNAAEATSGGRSMKPHPDYANVLCWCINALRSLKTKFCVL